MGYQMADWTPEDEERWLSDSARREAWQKTHRKAIEELVNDFGFIETVSYLITERIIQRAKVFRQALKPFDREG